MKKITIFSIFVLSLTLLIGCSGSGSSSSNNTTHDDSTLIILPADPYTGYTSTSINIEKDGDPVVNDDGWKLDQYILAADTKILNFHYNTAVDLRPLFAYRITASDGYNPYDDKGQPDLNWATVSGGYLLSVLNEKKTVFPGAGLASAYRVKLAYAFKILRKIDLIKSDASVVQLEIDSLISESLDWIFQPTTGDPVTHTGSTVIPLADLITADITAVPGSFTYKITAADGTTKTITWAQLQTSYYVVTDIDTSVATEEANKYEGRVLIANSDATPLVSGGGNTVKYAMSITLIP